MELYISSYLMIEFFTFVVSLVMLKKVNYNLGSEREVKIFRGLIFAFCMYLCSDVIWGLMAYSYIPVVRPLFIAISDLEFILEMFVSYFWFRYVSYTLQKKQSSLGILKLICRIYATLFILLVLTNRYTGVFYYFDSEGYFCFGRYCSSVIRLTQFVFFGGATFYGLIEFFKAKTAVRKRRCLRVIVFVLPIILAFFFYYKFKIAILIAPALYTSIMLYFLTVEDTMMYYDKLTGVYNRRRFEKYIEEKMQMAGKCTNITVYCIDIDNFKKINDTYGHFEGDRILRLIGEILKNMECSYNIFAARTGGDEFIVTIKTKDLLELGSFEDYIRAKIIDASKAEDMNYEIGISIGSQSCDDESIRFDEFVKKADKNMYIEKNFHHDSWK